MVNNHEYKSWFYIVQWFKEFCMKSKIDRKRKMTRLQIDPNPKLLTCFKSIAGKILLAFQKRDNSQALNIVNISETTKPIRVIF